MVYFSITFCKYRLSRRPLYYATRPQLVRVLRFAFIVNYYPPILILPLTTGLGQYNESPKQRMSIDRTNSFT